VQTPGYALPRNAQLIPKQISHLLGYRHNNRRNH